MTHCGFTEAYLASDFSAIHTNFLFMVYLCIAVIKYFMQSLIVCLPGKHSVVTIALCVFLTYQCALSCVVL